MARARPTSGCRPHTGVLARRGHVSRRSRSGCAGSASGALPASPRTRDSSCRPFTATSRGIGGAVSRGRYATQSVPSAAASARFPANRATETFGSKKRITTGSDGRALVEQAWRAMQPGDRPSGCWDLTHCVARDYCRLAYWEIIETRLEQSEYVRPRVNDRILDAYTQREYYERGSVPSSGVFR